jgi:hypothetical protein
MPRYVIERTQAPKTAAGVGILPLTARRHERRIVTLKARSQIKDRCDPNFAGAPFMLQKDCDAATYADVACEQRCG